MPIFSRTAFKNNLEYNKLAKQEVKIIKEQFANNNYEFAMNLMLGKNKFKVDGIEYEFKALKFNAGKSVTGIRKYSSQLASDLYEVNRYIPLDVDKISDVTVKTVGFEGMYPGLNYRDIKDDFLTEEEIDKEVAKTFPSTPEGSREIEKQNNIDYRNGKLEDRKNVDVSTVSSLDELKEEMNVQYLSEFGDESQEAYKNYLNLIEESRKEAQDEVDKYKTERTENLNKQESEKEKELENTLSTNAKLFENCMNKGDMKEFFDRIPGLDYKTYLSEKLDEKIHQIFGNVKEDDRIPGVVRSYAYNPLGSDTVSNVKKNFPEMLMAEGLDKNMLGKGTITVRELLEQEKETILKRAEELQKQGANKDIEDLRAKFNEETQKNVDKIYATYENGKTANANYAKGLSVAEKMGVDNNFIDKAVTVIKNAQDSYKTMSGVGRFFSYINPFPNKYREARNHISNMINELSSNTDINKKDITNYVYGKSTEKPQLEVPSFEEVSAKDLSVKNEILNKEIQSLSTGKEKVSSEVDFERQVANDIGSKQKNDTIKENGKDAIVLENAKEQSNVL